MSRKRPTIGFLIYFAISFSLGAYFTFAAVQGDFGLFQRLRIEADARALGLELDSYRNQVSVLQNKTRRLSDTFLDLDLLDEQARDVLGMVRPDEIVLP
ncbi:MAG: septum formation initiator family protein [Paracoccaceae bacterium]